MHYYHKTFVVAGVEFDLSAAAEDALEESNENRVNDAQLV